MKVTRFDPHSDLILIHATIWGPSGSGEALLALDTAASQTIVSPTVLDVLGYSARDAVRLTSVTSVLGREVGYQLRVKRFEALGFAFDDFLLNAHEFPDDSDIDGLLGLSFLRNFNYEIRSQEGLLRVIPV